MKQVKNVLLIDDDKMFSMINERILNIAKFASSVKSFSSAADALKELKLLIKTNPDKFPDVIFLDINMPEMDGWAFLEAVKKFSAAILKKCKIFILSSSIDGNDIARSKTYKMVCDLIPKPLSLSKLEMLSFK